jgi:hypothetical protein
MPTLKRRCSSIAICLIVGALGGCMPHEPGYSSRELEGVEGIEVVSAQLRYDLRPLVDSKPADIVSIYRLKNPGPAKEIELFLVCPNAGLKGVSAQLDGAALPIEIRSVAHEKGWPKDVTSITGATGTPRPGSASLLEYRCNSENTGVIISAKLPPGNSELRIEYGCTVTQYVIDNPTRIWQIVHHFKPAAKWSKFGPIQVSVDYPPGWEIADNLGMVSNGERLERTFAERPTEPLQIGTRFMPDKNEWRLYQGLNVLVGAVLLVVVLWLGRSSGRRLAKWELRELDYYPSDGNLAIVLLLSAIVSFGMVWWSVKGSYLLLVPENQRTRDFESSAGCSLICMGPPAIVFAVLGSWFLFWLVRKLVCDSIVQAAPHVDEYRDEWDRRGPLR